VDCKKTFSERKGTALFYTKKPVKTISRIVQALCDGNGIRGTARVCGVDRSTVATCLRKTGYHADALSSRLTHNIKLSEVQIDEAHTFVFKKDKNLTPQDRILHPDAGAAWLFSAIDAPTKFIPLIDVATDVRMEATKRFFRSLARRLNMPWPLFATDMRNVYQEAVEMTLHGDPRGVRYVQARGHTFDVVQEEYPNPIRSKIIFGDKDSIERHYKQSPASNRINTAFIEVFHKTLRTANRRLARRSNGISKKRRQLRLQLALFTAYYNFVKEHRSLRLENGLDGSNRKWDARTPAMAAKLTDHRWTVEELLSFVM
jgi:transposase-like protein